MNGHIGHAKAQQKFKEFLLAPTALLAVSATLFNISLSWKTSSEMNSPRQV